MLDERALNRALFLFGDQRDADRLSHFLQTEAGAVTQAVHETFEWQWLDTASGTFHLAGLRILRKRRGAQARSASRPVSPGPYATDTVRRRQRRPGDARPENVAQLPATGFRLTPFLLQNGVGHSFQTVSRALQASFFLARCTFILPGTKAETKEARFVEISWPAFGNPVNPWEALIRDRFHGLPLGSDWVRFGLEALGGSIPGSAPADPSNAPGWSLSIPEHAGRYIDKQLRKIRSNTEGAALDLDPEFVHDIRVATRKLRFILRLLAPQIGPKLAFPLRDRLRRIALACGAVRDLDMLVHFLGSIAENHEIADHAAWEDLHETLSTERRRAHRAMVRMLHSRQMAELREQLEALLPAGPPPSENTGNGPLPAPPPADWTVCLDSLRQAVTDISKATRMARYTGRSTVGEMDPVRLHRLRILFKRLRYTCEYYSPWADPVFKPVVTHFVSIQDRLGLHQDARSALAYLHEHLEKFCRSSLKPDETAFLLGFIFACFQRQARDCREQFLELWRVFPRLLRRFREQLGNFLGQGGPGLGAETIKSPRLGAWEMALELVRPVPVGAPPPALPSSGESRR